MRSRWSHQKSTKIVTITNTTKTRTMRLIQQTKCTLENTKTSSTARFKWLLTTRTRCIMTRTTVTCQTEKDQAKVMISIRKAHQLARKIDNLIKMESMKGSFERENESQGISLRHWFENSIGTLIGPKRPF